MIKKITLHNFMSHAHSEIELSPGLTVLTGPNNCGKSAIVVALDVLCNNLSGDFMIRHGEKECYVSVELNEDHVVTWRRKGKVASYEINGREVHRLGKGGIPDDLHDVLRMPQIQHPGQQGTAFDVHLAHQKAPIFLLDQPGSRAAMFFASSSDAEKLLRMQQLHRQKVRQARQALNLKKTAVEGLRIRQATLVVLHEIDERGKQALAEEHQLAEFALQRERGAGLLSRLERAEDTQRTWAEENHCLQALTSPPVLQNTRVIAELIEQIHGSQVRLNLAQARAQCVQTLEAPPRLHDTASLRLGIQNRIDAEAKHGRWTAEVVSLSGLAESPTTAQTQPLRLLINRLDRQTKRRQDGALVTNALDTLMPPPAWAPTEPLRHKIAQLLRAEGQLDQASAYADLLGAMHEQPQLGAPLLLEQAIARLEQAHSQVVRLTEDIDHIEHSVRDVAENLHWAEKARIAPAAPSSRRWNPVVSLAIAVVLVVAVGGAFWLLQPRDTIIPAPDRLGADQAATSDALTDAGPDTTQPLSGTPDRSTQPSDPIRSAEAVTERAPQATSSANLDLETPPSQNIAITAAPLDSHQIDRPSFAATDEIGSLERERRQLDETVQRLEARIEASRFELEAAKERLATVEEALLRLRRALPKSEGGAR